MRSDSVDDDDLPSAGRSCISFPWAGSDQFLNTDTGMLTLTLGGVDYPYPTSYGMDLCAPHDQLTPPSCADADGVALADAPDWCASRWCYVDPDNCDITFDPSSYFHREGEDVVLYYSYETCSQENTFQDSEYDEQACNEEHSEVVAEHCVGLVDDDRCIDTWPDRADFENADGTKLLVPLEGETWEYNLGYGSGNCAPHDSDHAPYCADTNGTPMSDAPWLVHIQLVLGRPRQLSAGRSRGRRQQLLPP
jgi:hypothetical protein